MLSSFDIGFIAALFVFFTLFVFVLDWRRGSSTTRDLTASGFVFLIGVFECIVPPAGKPASIIDVLLFRTHNWWAMSTFAIAFGLLFGWVVGALVNRIRYKRDAT